MLRIYCVIVIGYEFRTDFVLKFDIIRDLVGHLD